MSKTKTIEKFVFIKWDDKKKDLYDIIKRCELQSNDECLQVNKIYKAKYGSTLFDAEFLYEGSKSVCEKIWQKLGKPSRRVEPMSMNAVPSKPNEQINSSDSDIESLVDVDAVKLKKKSKTCSNNDHRQKDDSDFETDGFDSVNDTKQSQKSGKNKPKIQEENNETSLKQLQEREILIEDYKKKLELNSQTIESLKGEIEVLQKLNDKNYIRDIVNFSVGVLKFLASSADRDEIKKFSANSEKLVLSVKYPTVLVYENFFVQTQMLIDAEKSKQVVFKSMVTSLIPDVELWANTSGEFMRTNHGSVLNACREYLNSKKIFLRENEFKQCLREICNACKTRLINQAAEQLKNNKTQTPSPTKTNKNVNSSHQLSNPSDNTIMIPKKQTTSLSVVSPPQKTVPSQFLKTSDSKAQSIGEDSDSEQVLFSHSELGVSSISMTFNKPTTSKSEYVVNGTKPASKPKGKKTSPKSKK